jgi:hypothetical protein
MKHDVVSRVNDIGANGGGGEDRENRRGGDDGVMEILI